MINALQKKYEAEIAMAMANIDVYITNPAGIGEHSDIIAALDIEMTKLAEAEDKLQCLFKNYISSHSDGHQG
jgi:hypothetical protein|tara:strand:- start:26 stop:241 length:216 start_codon:yes stop_codon:yes gene_type:complete